MADEHPPKGICTPFVLEGLGCWASQSPLLLHGRVVAMELLEVNVRQSFSAIRTLMARALGLQDSEPCGARQCTLQTKLRGTIDESSFCLLNDIFLVEVRASGLSGPGEGLLMSFSGSDVVWARCWECLSSGVGIVGVVAQVSHSWALGGSLSGVSSCPALHLAVPGALFSTLEVALERGWCWASGLLQPAQASYRQRTSSSAHPQAPALPATLSRGPLLWAPGAAPTVAPCTCAGER